MAENKTLYELDPDMRKKATAAYNASHGHAPDYGFAPDRAWIEGWACAAAPQAQADARDAVTEHKPLIARQLGEWHEDDGPVAWWAWCGHEWAGEPAWIGTPLCDTWPGYHTHWTPHPDFPNAARAAQQGDAA